MAEGILPSPPALNLNGNEARLVVLRRKLTMKMLLSCALFEKSRCDRIKLSNYCQVMHTKLGFMRHANSVVYIC